MKYFIAIALLATVASAAVVRPSQVASELSTIQNIVNAINNPNTSPSAVALLRQLLQNLITVIRPEPVNPEPSKPEPIFVGPALVEFPAGDGGALTPIETVPVVVPPAESDPVSPASNPSLVQIIVNVNQDNEAVAGFPAGSASAPESVFVVETAPETVSVVESAPEAVIVAHPELPAPAVVLPDVLN